MTEWQPGRAQLLTDFHHLNKETAQLARQIKACRLCVERPDGSPLPHEPNPVAVLSSSAKIVLCGQAPGNRVHQSGRPFTDPSGDRLRQWLGVSDEQFYDPSLFAIVPMGFCFPGNDRHGGDLPPRPECQRQWHPKIFAAMPQLELKVLIGGSAQAFHLGNRRKKSVTETVAAWREYVEEGREKGVVEIPLPHPSWRNSAWLKKNLWFASDLLPELQKMIQAKIN